MVFNLVIIHVNHLWELESTKPANGYGGTSTYISGLLRYLSDYNNFNKLYENGRSVNDQILSFNTIIARSNSSLILKLISHSLNSIFTGKQYIYYCQRPDHLAFSLMAPGKHVVHLHGQPQLTINNNRNYLTKLIYNALERFSLRYVDSVIATDKFTKNLYSSLYPQIKPRITVIPTGVNLHVCNIGNGSDAFPGILPGTFNFVFIGRLVYPKQVEIVMKAFNQAFNNSKSVHLWIAGSGKDENRLKNLALNLKCVNNIHFTGRISHENVVKLIKTADVGILISHNEGSPIVVKELLACGKPVIANDVGDIKEYVVDGINGYIVDTNLPSTIENAMLNIIPVAKSMAVAARDSILPFDEKKIYEKVLDVFRKLEIES